MPDLWMDVDIALSEVPVNIMPLLDDTDFKTRETAVAYNAAGMDLVWNFVTTGGSFTQTAVTPTTGGNYDWTHQGDGIYTIEIPASGGASINNDTEGFGWFSGVATGVLPWRGPMIGFRAAGLNDALIDSAYSATRGLAGTALPNAAADAAGGLPISDAGGLDLDARLDAAVSSRLAPTTAGRTLDVTATGAAGIDWGNLENPTTAVNLSATNIDTDQVVASVTGAVGSVTGGVTVTTNNDKTGYALSSAGIQAIWDALTSALTAVGSIGKLIVDNLNATISSRASQTSVDTIDDLLDTEIAGIITTLGTPAGASISADIAAIEAQTDDIGAAGAGLTAIPWNAAWDAEVQSEVQDALEANNLDHLVGTATGIPAIPAGTFLDQIVDDGTASYDRTTDSLQAIRDRGDAAWGGAGSSDWTATEKEHIRYRLQIDGTQTTPTVDAPVQLPVDAQKWAGDTPNPLIGGRVDAILGSFLIDESRVDAACTEAGQTQSFTTNLTETEDDYYAGWVFMFTDAGTNRAVPRVVRLYNGTTKEITLVTPLPANTTNGHAFALIALTTGAELTDGSMALNQGYTASAVLDAEQAGFLTAGTIGESINEAANKPTANENADALLKRDWTAVTGEAGRSVLNALRFLRNKWSVAGATLTVTKEDDATSAWTATVTTDAAADPVTGSDPA